MAPWCLEKVEKTSALPSFSQGACHGGGGGGVDGDRKGDDVDHHLEDF